MHGALHKQEARGSLSEWVSPCPIPALQMEQLQVMWHYHSGGTWEQSEAWNCWKLSWHQIGTLQFVPFQVQYKRFSYSESKGRGAALEWLNHATSSSCQLTLLSLVDHQTGGYLMPVLLCLCIGHVTFNSCNTHTYIHMRRTWVVWTLAWLAHVLTFIHGLDLILQHAQQRLLFGKK